MSIIFIENQSQAEQFLSNLLPQMQAGSKTAHNKRKVPLEERIRSCAKHYQEGGWLFKLTDFFWSIFNKSEWQMTTQHVAAALNNRYRDYYKEHPVNTSKGEEKIKPEEIQEMAHDILMSATYFQHFRWDVEWLNSSAATH